MWEIMCLNPVEKETAENFYGTGERDHQLMLRYDGVRGCGALAGGYRPPEQKRHGYRAYVGKTPEGRPFQTKNSLPKKAKSFSFGGAGGIRTHGPRKANGFRVRLVMTTSILLHDEMISGDG